MKTRKLVDNVIDIDSACFIAVASRQSEAILTLFDFAAAFPSVAWSHDSMYQIQNQNQNLYKYEAGGAGLAELGWRSKAGGARLAELGWQSEAGGARLAKLGWRSCDGGARLAQ